MLITLKLRIVHGVDMTHVCFAAMHTACVPHIVRSNTAYVPEHINADQTRAHGAW